MEKVKIFTSNVHKIVIDGIEYVPKEEKSPTQGLTDEQLINVSLFEADEYRQRRRENDPRESLS